MFSVRAQTNCTLLVVKSEVMLEAMNLFPAYFAQIVSRSVERYLSVKLSVIKFSGFKGINRIDPFWTETITGQLSGGIEKADFHQVITEWLNKIDQKNRLGESILIGNMNER